MNSRGTTLLETLIAVAMITTVIVVVSLVFPKASANVTNSRRRWFANNFATARLQEIKSQPYPLIDVSTFGFTTAIGTCNCSQDDFSNMPIDGIMTQDNVTFKRQSCVHLVDRVAGNWTSACPENAGPVTSGDSGSAASDHGLKNIRVKVTWTSGNQKNQVETQGLVMRQ
jgi:Tfp pilus assembly protein PilV